LRATKEGDRGNLESTSDPVRLFHCCRFFVSYDLDLLLCIIFFFEFIGSFSESYKLFEQHEVRLPLRDLELLSC